MLPWRAPILIIGLACALGAAAHAHGGEFWPGGEGSGASNPDLLRPGYDCDQLCAARGVPDESYAKFFDIDWRLGLRGAFVSDSDGERFQAIALPGVTLSHEGQRARVNLTGDAEIIKASDADLRLATLSAAVRFDYLLDSVTAVRFGASFGQSQEDAHVPGQSAILLVAPKVWTGAVDAELSRRFGRADAALRGRVGRVVHSETINTDLSTTDNSSQNYTALSGGLRLGFAVTPIISVFADASVERDVFDIASPSLLVKTDANSYALRGGVKGQWRRLEAEASIGIGHRDFDDASLTDVLALLFDASATWRPDEATSLAASFATTMAPPGPNAGGTARVQYEASLTGERLINNWLKLRARVDWRQATFSGSSETERGYGLSAGADYIVNSHATVSADYRFSHIELTPNPAYDSHRFTLGVNVKR